MKIIAIASQKGGTGKAGEQAHLILPRLTGGGYASGGTKAMHGLEPRAGRL